MKGKFWAFVESISWDVVLATWLILMCFLLFVLGVALTTVHEDPRWLMLWVPIPLLGALAAGVIMR